jgi:FixJ family two-component response regulator
MTVRAMKAGATDFLTKPVSSKLLIERILVVLQQESEKHKGDMEKEALCHCLSTLTPREFEVLPLIVDGQSNKVIARKLGISYRTIEVHRARILHKTGVKSYLELARLYDIFELQSRNMPN